MTDRTDDEWDRAVDKILHTPPEPDDVPDELEEAARAELGYGADETDEG
jgi:hypothetical protein